MSDQIEEVTITEGAQILDIAPLDQAAEALQQLDSDKATAILEELESSKAASILDLVDTGKVVELLSDISSDYASEILALVSPAHAGDIMANISPAKTIEIVQLMDQAKLIERLPEMPVERLSQIPVQVLFDKLPKVPASQLAIENPPQAGAGLPPPTAVEVTSTLVIYTVPDTGELEWATLVGSPAPIDKILARFTRRQTGLRVQVEQLIEMPSRAPEFAPGQVASAFFRVDLENVEPQDVATAHVTFFVEKEWLKDNGIHKWSIQVQRLDSRLNSWVAFPSKRLREDSERVFYSVALPGFSVFAITGSKEIPDQIFSVTDLEIKPTSAVVGQIVIISAKVTNKYSDLATYPASLWINDQIETVQPIEIPGGQTVPITFSIAKSEGIYRVRLERLLSEFEVRPEATSTPIQSTPSNVATATSTPTAATASTHATHRHKGPCGPYASDPPAKRAPASQASRSRPTATNTKRRKPRPC